MEHIIPLLQIFPELPTKCRIQPKFLTWFKQALYGPAPLIAVTLSLPVSSSLARLQSHWPLLCLSNVLRSPYFETFLFVIPTLWKVFPPNPWMTGFFLTTQVSKSLLQPGHPRSLHLKQAPHLSNLLTLLFIKDLPLSEIIFSIYL